MAVQVSKSLQVKILNEFDKAKNTSTFEEEYILEKEETTYQNNMKIVTSVYFDKKNNSTIKKTSKYCMDYIRSQERERSKAAIEKRSKWKKFGDAIDDTSHLNGGNIGEDVFMSWNPEIFKSRKTQAFMKQYMNDYANDKHTEEIQYQSEKILGYDKPKILQEYDDVIEQKESMTQYRQELDKMLNKLITNNVKPENVDSTPIISDTNNTNDSDEPKLFKVNKSGKNSISKTEEKGYVAPGLRNKKSNSDANDQENNQDSKYASVFVSNTDHIKIKSKVKNKEINKKCIRVCNLPEDCDFQSILSCLKPILGRIYFKLKTLNNRNTGKLRDFCFLNFNDEISSEQAFKKLQNVKMGHCILQIEWGVKRD